MIYLSDPMNTEGFIEIGMVHEDSSADTSVLLSAPCAGSHGWAWVSRETPLPHTCGIPSWIPYTTIPKWAEDYGVDLYGPYVELKIGNCSQYMRWVPPGVFAMGSPNRERYRALAEGPIHTVRLTKGFWLADTPCTQRLWKIVLGTNPSHFQDNLHPVENISWWDCQSFLANLGCLVDANCRLPTEAEWEYACRAGTETLRYSKDINSIAWYDSNSYEKTHAVGLKRPNLWGLYDMLGNVWEWCQDPMRAYAADSVVDPIGPKPGSNWRSIRGGSWNNRSWTLRAACRSCLDMHDKSSGVGFRFAISGEDE